MSSNNRAELTGGAGDHSFWWRLHVSSYESRVAMNALERENKAHGSCSALRHSTCTKHCLTMH
jgi:hypothetical protein